MGIDILEIAINWALFCGDKSLLFNCAFALFYAKVNALWSFTVYPSALTLWILCINSPTDDIFIFLAKDGLVGSKNSVCFLDILYLTYYFFFFSLQGIQIPQLNNRLGYTPYG